MRSVVIHGHFYQPPRENPWLEEIERERSAAPYHDWNTRIEQECYRAVVAARVLAPDGRISRIVNTLERISFNVGPTLLEWMERAAPDTYARVLAADRASLARLGHGNAIAQPYHHAILPLSSRRDKVTEVRWGIADFRRRFGRDPEGMWLPETALDDATLDVLAQEGIRFTIVAPGQVRTVPDDGRPGRYTTSQGRTIALCIYDGDLSHGIAFGGLLGDAHAWARRMLAHSGRERTPHDSAAVDADHWEPDPESDGGTRPLTTGEYVALAEREVPRRRGRHQLVSAATDGETYGHHHRFAEMALARVLLDLEAAPGVRVENFASYLARHPATDDVEIVAPSAWSCAHGVERWRSNCGCRMREGTDQQWRAPLRDAITTLATGLHEVYERHAVRWFGDPWAVRDAYGEVVATPERIPAWVAARVRPDAPAPGAGERSPAELLEMERGALRIFTSCAWFFDDIGGLEPLEVLRYAARAIELAGDDGAVLEAAFVARLADARSGMPGVGTGRDVYLGVAKPSLSQTLRLAASVAAARATSPDDPRWRHTSPALIVDALDSSVTVVQRRTGMRETFAVRVAGIPAGADGRLDPAVPHRAASIVAQVTASPPRDVTLAEMTEAQHAAIVDGVRRRLIAIALRRDGEQPPTDASLASALVEALAALAPALDDAGVQRVAALLDLMEIDGVGIPFDAQTRFHDIVVSHAASAPADPRLAALGRRLGFASELFARVAS